MDIFKINDVIIKMDNYEHQTELFRLGSIYKKLSRPISAINPLSLPLPHSPPPPHMKNAVGVPP
jgi:hypothetical protein